jgi:hypothetical protein
LFAVLNFILSSNIRISLKQQQKEICNSKERCISKNNIAILFYASNQHHECKERYKISRNASYIRKARNRLNSKTLVTAGTSAIAGTPATEGTPFKP